MTKYDNTTWSVAEAKAHLSRVLAEASEAPQIIERRGRRVAVVVGAEAYRALTGAAAASEPRARWKRFLRLSADLRASGGVDIELPPRIPRATPFGRRASR